MLDSAFAAATAVPCGYAGHLMLLCLLSLQQTKRPLLHARSGSALVMHLPPAVLPCAYARHPVLLYLLSLHCTRQKSQVHNGMVRLLFKGAFAAAAAAAAAAAGCLPPHLVTMPGICVLATQKLHSYINARQHKLQFSWFSLPLMSPAGMLCNSC